MVLGAGEPQPALRAREQPLGAFANGIDGDQDAAERKPAVQVGPEHEERHVEQERAAGGVLQQLEQDHDQDQREQVRPREPVRRTEHRRSHAHQVGQQRVAAAANEKPGNQRIGEGEDQSREHRYAGQPRGLVRTGVDQLTAVLEREKWPAGHGEREHVLPEQRVMVQHQLAEPEVPREVAVAVEEAVAEAHRHHHGPDNEDDVEEADHRRTSLGPNAPTRRR